MNKTIPTFLFFLLSICAFSQIQYKDADIIPPSPNAFLLGLYGQNNVSMATGTLNETIELYRYKTTNLTVPINLHYSTNGIKVDQVESNVGIDWILEAGGVITRVVKGKPDEERRGELISDLHCYSQEMVNYVFNSTYTHQNDTEPDIFMFNFMGKSGNFVLDNQKNVMQIEQKDLKFEIIKEGFGIENFVATDEMGIQYFFTAQEKTMLQVEDLPPQSAITAWYLTKIVHPKGDEIYFTYKKQSYSYLLARDESTKFYGLFLNKCPESISHGLHTTTIITSYQFYISGVILEAITSNIKSAGTIQLENNFIPRLNRPADYYSDLPTGYNFISSITQKDGTGKILEKVNLEYGNRNRVFLDKVDFTISSKKYELIYNGIPNKRNGNKDAWGYNSSETAIYPDPFKNYLLYRVDITYHIEKHKIITGDKFTSDAIYDGLLTKIIYPTKGYNTFEYGKNQTIGDVLIPDKTSMINMILNYSNKNEVIYFTNKEQDFATKISIGINLDSYPEGTDLQLPWDYEGHSFILSEESPKGSNKYIHFGTYSAVNILEGATYFFKLKGDTKYKLEGKYTYYNDDLHATAKLDYLEVPKHTTKQPIYVNGVHINKIKSYDSNGTLINYKKYYYNKKDSNESSGELYYRLPSYFSSGKQMSLCYAPNSVIPHPIYNDYSMVHSKSVIPMFSELGNNKMTFERVTTSEGGDNFEKGGEEYFFNIYWPALEENCSMHHTSPPVWTSGNLNHGKLRVKNILDNNQKTIKSTEYTYKEEYEKRKTTIGVAIQMNFNSIYLWTNDGTNINPLNISHLGITKYKVVSFKHYLQQVKTKTFTSSGAVIEETVNNFYDSPNHLQLSKRETVYNNKTKTDKFYYPDDVLYVNSLPEGAFSNPQFDAIKALKKDKSHETATVIQKESFINNKKIGTERINYLLTSNKSLPHEIQWKKQETLPFEKTATFKHYNNFGLPIEIENKGTNTVYLYGYHQSLLIAKIENSTKESVASALGVTVADLTTVNETKLTQINNLRQNANFKGAMITTYEHKPLIGISKMTDPKGLSIFYEYNTANQLQNIKDASGNILEEYEYNYKPN